MRKIFKVVGLVVLVALIGLGAFVARGLFVQGVDDGFWKTYKTATVVMDRHGIPTIEGGSWGQVVEAQGYVVAAARLWQMDLIRRKASGRLAEWFGEAAFAHDERMRREGRSDVVRSAVDKMPPGERTSCDLFAQGVNAFIQQHSGRWGAEYFLLRTKPEPWTCGDSLYVLLEMADTLTSSAERDARGEVWRRNLSPAWQEFLFPLDHPWNRPLFGEATRRAPSLPPPAEHLSSRPLEPSELGAARSVATTALAGSNNWSWRGRTGAFLANDPHLGVMVPGLWYAMRLRVSASDWAVGAALPGLPGIVIGMNPGISWAFTNTGEDVDDYLLETISDDGNSYVASMQDGKPVWAKIIRRSYSVVVSGESRPRDVQASFTHRGPLLNVPALGAGLYSRQWLPLKDGILRLPATDLMRSRTFDDFNRALDNLKIPSQNVLTVDRAGGLGYRMSGTGVVRTVTGQRPQSAVVGEWGGTEPAERRLRMYLAPDGSDEPRHLATANERVWIDPYGASWAADDRKNRIDQVLSARDNLVREDMERLHLDTKGRFRRVMLTWVADHVQGESEQERAVLAEWRAWDGDSRSNTRVFAQSTLVEDRLMAILTGRISQRFPEADRDALYSWYLDRAWLLVVMEASGDDGLRPFGLTAGDVARHLVSFVVKNEATLVPHEVANRWSGQHPFVGKIPLADLVFGVETHPQWGAHDLVLAESPAFGPSMRMVWDMRQPDKSRWIFPVGQSGHAHSQHFHELQSLWTAGATLPVFDDGLTWKFED